MSTSGIVALIAITLVGVASAIIGSIGVRVARSTSDFLVASRTVGPVANASAISGEYLSAASFLGVAGMILRDGADALWYPIGFTAGYLALVLFVAAPLRRSGAYTVPDFAVARLNSDGLRRLCTVFVLIIGWLYLLPQLQGAGLTLTTLTGPARLERHRRRGAGRRAHRGRRRHAVDHLRAGVPVLAQAHRAGRACRVRARPVPLGQPQPGARRRPRLPRRDDRRRAHGRRPADSRAGEPGGRRHGRRGPGERAADVATGPARGHGRDRAAVPGGLAGPDGRRGADHGPGMARTGLRGRRQPDAGRSTPC